MSEQLEQDFNEVSNEPVEISVPEAQTIQDCEWCFQFFNNEPIVFAWQNEEEEPTPLVLQIQPVESEGLVFRQNGMEFKIFPRPISEESKKARLEQNGSTELETTN
jgi:hypothetical protein